MPSTLNGHWDRSPSALVSDGRVGTVVQDTFTPDALDLRVGG